MTSNQRRAGATLLSLLTLSLVLTLAARAQESPEELFEEAVRGAVERVAPSIVTIETVGGLETTTVQSGQREGQLLLGTGPTAGLVVSEEGYVVSSVFNFLSKPEAILVTLSNGKRASATIVARDHARMLVLLKVDTDEKLTPPAFVKKSEIQVGQTAIAVGAAASPAGRRISTGILSAQGRIFGRALQTDARVTPANYGGPLVDIEGRVMGVVVPLSPTAQSEVAGLEWYDTGVGFAIPFEDLHARVETMRQGKDIFPGLLGIGIKAGDRFTDPAVVSVVRPNSPAAKVGIKVNDEVLNVAGKRTGYIAAFMDAMGVFDAGASPKLRLKRGDKELEFSPVLVDQLPPYHHASLGIWLTRGDEPPTVRALVSNGPAEEARLLPKDVIVAVGGTPVANRAELLERLTALQPGEKATLTVKRGAANVDRPITLGSLADVEQLNPEDLPPRSSAPDAKPLEKTGRQTLALEEERVTCDILLPPGPPPHEGFALLVHLGTPASMNADNLEATWGKSAPDAGVIVLSLRPADATRWLPSEVRSLLQAIEAAAAKYPIDRERIVIAAERPGMPMALQAARKRDLIRGVALIDAELPPNLKLAENEPQTRQKFLFLTRNPDSVGKAAESLRKEGFQVIVPVLPIRGDKDIPVASGELFRWIDSLDAL